MNILMTTLIFLALSFVTFFLVNRYVKTWLPESWLSSSWTMRILSVLFAFAAIYFITAWGFRPSFININFQQNVDNPLRWFNWLLSALCFGVAQACFQELLYRRSQEVPTKVTQGRRTDML